MKISTLKPLGLALTLAGLMTAMPARAVLITYSVDGSDPVTAGNDTITLNKKNATQIDLQVGVETTITDFQSFSWTHPGKIITATTPRIFPAQLRQLDLWDNR